MLICVILQSDMKKKSKYNVAVVGAGAVGIELLRILRERSFPVGKLRVFARSERDIAVDGIKYHVEDISGREFNDIDIALFAGTEGARGASVTYSGDFISRGAVVIDNGSDFRLKDGVPLIVPEANRQEILNHKGIIANPNCTTIQAVVALAGIYKKFGIKRIILVSFQATSGAGRGAAQALWDETKEIIDKNKNVPFVSIDKRIKKDSFVLGKQIAFNAIPQIGEFKEKGFTSEEWKVVNEIHKIFNDDSINISATCVRIPVFTSHSEAVYFETKKEAGLTDILSVLRESDGVALSDDKDYPLAVDVEGTNSVYVGRARRDISSNNSFWLWVVADNLRKGAALNAVQIAEELIRG